MERMQKLSSGRAELLTAELAEAKLVRMESTPEGAKSGAGSSDTTREAEPPLLGKREEVVGPDGELLLKRRFGTVAAPVHSGSKTEGKEKQGGVTFSEPEFEVQRQKTEREKAAGVYPGGYAPRFKCRGCSRFVALLIDCEQEHELVDGYGAPCGMHKCTERECSNCISDVNGLRTCTACWWMESNRMNAQKEKDAVYEKDAWKAGRPTASEPPKPEQYKIHSEESWTGTEPIMGKGKGAQGPVMADAWAGYQSHGGYSAPTFGVEKGFAKGVPKGKGKDDSMYRAFGEVPVASLGPGGLRWVQADKMKEEIDFGKMMRNAVAAEHASGDPRVGGVQYVPKATDGYAFDLEAAHGPPMPRRDFMSEMARLKEAAKAYTPV
jgi:hypothetical protein